MKYLLYRIFNLILSPVRYYFSSFIFLTIALIIPELVSEIDFDWIKDFSIQFLNYRLLICVAVSYILVCLAYIFSRINSKLGLSIIIIFHIFIYTLVFTDVFLYLSFGSHINAYMLQLAHETNSQETSEFLGTYLSTRKFAKVLIAIILFLCLEFLFTKRRIISINLPYNECWQSVVNKCKVIFSSFICIYILLSLAFLIHLRSCLTFDWASNLEDEKIWNYYIVNSFAFRTYQTCVQFLDDRNDFDRCEQALQNITASIASEKTIIQDIVIIIGESYNRHHSFLYGYDLETTPRLSQLNNLYVFDDVITSINSTTPAFKDFLSMASVDDSLSWCDTPLFPAFFKHVGYNVIFFSNQFVKTISMNPYDASAGFFNHPKVEPLVFSHRNSEKHKYDENLIEDFINVRQEIENDSLNLVFFHLIGQHVSTFERYPKGREVFHTDDYQRPELTAEQKQEVANYDNATYYNDSVVYEIVKLYQDRDAIILYFADHGDEANDYRPYIGRALNLNDVGAPGLHCQLDIPFIIYLTDSFSIKHPALVSKIANSVHKPFMLDDLPHLLLDIAGISTPWYKPSRSIINENYNSQRRRIIDGYSTTSPIDYDSICDAYGKWKIGFNNPSYDK